MDLRVSRASAVVVQRVPAALRDWFLDWQRGISQIAGGYPGYGGTDVYPPGDSQTGEWVVVVHFDDDRALRAWLDSPERTEWVDKLQSGVGDFELNAMPQGFGAWFTGLGRRAEAPASWKMALTVLLALYPTVMLLAIFVGPYTDPAGMAVSMLIGNMLSISILQWGVMPVLTKALGRWLNASPSREPVVSIAGLGLVAAILAVMTLIFRSVKG